MGKIWLIMLVAALSALIINNPDLAIKAMTSGANEAVSLAVELVALYAFWLGFFALLEKLDISERIAVLLKPLVKFLFKNADEKTGKYITMNMSANLLGLGNAATPMGINAIRGLSAGKTFATTDIIMMIVISSTSLQLLPSTVIGMRSLHGSAAPASFLLASVVATIFSTLFGIALVKLCSRFFTDEKYIERLSKRKTKRLFSFPFRRTTRAFPCEAKK